MANELTISASLVHDDSVSNPVALQSAAGLMASVVSKLRTFLSITVGVTERSIPLGDVTAPRWAFFYNRSTTASVALRTGSGVSPFCQLAPGEFCLLPLAPTVTAPFAYASEAGCELEYLICNT